MRFIIMHRTNAHWEAGALPGPDLLARVGTLLQAMAKGGVLEGAEGLRPSSEGVRVEFASGARRITPGPLDGTDDLLAGCSGRFPQPVTGGPRSRRETSRASCQTSA